LPEGTEVSFSQDKSKDIRQLLFDLQNSVLTAVILVFIVILYALSVRASLLIGLAIPASFLMGMLALSLMGYTVNIVVLFSLILAVGDAGRRRHHRHRICRAPDVRGDGEARGLRDGVAQDGRPGGRGDDDAGGGLLAAAVLAGDRRRVHEVPADHPDRDAVGLAVYALIFVPTLGALIAKPFKHPPEHKDGAYMWVVGKAVRHPWIMLTLAIGLLGAVPYAYVQYGKGVIFFPDVEPEFGLLYVKARGNLSIAEKDALVAQAEARILGWPGVETVYTRTGAGGGMGQEVDADVIGVIQYEFVDWRERKNANAILADLRQAMVGIPGVDIQVSVPQAGPPTGKAIQIQLSADDPTYLNEVAVQVAERLAQVPDVIDISNGLPPPGVDWELQVDRAAASRYGIAPSTVGGMVQLVTGGLKLSDYRPAGADDAVDIVLRLPADQRTISALDQLRIQTAEGSVPISNFVTRKAAPTTGTLTRLDGSRTVTVQAGIREGVQADAIYAQVTKELEAGNLDQYGIRWKLAGEDAEQAEAGAFLSKAFRAAIFLIFIVLLAQFNNFTSVWLVLSAVVMSTIGVLLGLMIMGQPFTMVMTGIGIIALAGVVVNNNIVLIDTYDTLRREGSPEDRGDPADLPRTRPPRGPDRADGDPGRASHRLRPEHGASQPRGDHRRALDPVVDRAVVGHRLRAGLRDRADADHHPLDADAGHAGRQPEALALAAAEAARVVCPLPTRKAARPGTAGRIGQYIEVR
jgi:multidrug efflux pump